jgi:hypothetical protein
MWGGPLGPRATPGRPSRANHTVPLHRRIFHQECPHRLLHPRRRNHHHANQNQRSSHNRPQAQSFAAQKISDQHGHHRIHVRIGPYFGRRFMMNQPYVSRFLPQSTNSPVPDRSAIVAPRIRLGANNYGIAGTAEGVKILNSRRTQLSGCGRILTSSAPRSSSPPRSKTARNPPYCGS